MSWTFAPSSLLPRLHHFQSLDRVHTLTLNEFNLPLWATHYQTCFSHFYPTLTSLTLNHCVGYDELILQFVPQFPRLESLCVERVCNWLDIVLLASPIPTVTVKQSPPLCGHLRLIAHDYLPQLTAYLLREGVNFRSVELEKFRWDRAQPILNPFAHTLECLTIVPGSNGMYHLLFPSAGMAK